MNSRTIQKRTKSEHLCSLLQSLFAIELLNPSPVVWIVSPWLSNIEIIDNRQGMFSTLQPTWSRSEIRLLKVIEAMLERHTSVHVAMNEHIHNEKIVDELKELKGQTNLRLKTHRQAKLHTKGILTDYYFLSGSMNFTYNGIQVNSETITLQTDPNILSKQRLSFTGWLGGEIL